MRVSHEIPPIYWWLKTKHFPAIEWDEGIVITVGDIVYTKGDLTKDLEVHEGVHTVQQMRMGPDLWWDRYVHEPEFRMRQELEAYRAQARYLEKTRSRESAFHAIMKLAKDLSSPIYGKCCTFQDAHRMIREK